MRVLIPLILMGALAVALRALMGPGVAYVGVSTLTDLVYVFTAGIAWGHGQYPLCKAVGVLLAVKNVACLVAGG